MDLGFEEANAIYNSGSQQAKNWTEQWVAKWMYCPNCGNKKLNQFQANLPVADFFCANCNEQYELKSKKTKFGNKLANGAYHTKIERLESDTSPNLILMNYNFNTASVQNIILIPKPFFVSKIIEERKPLAATARRAGWIGSNILLNQIPKIGLIDFIKNGNPQPKEEVLSNWNKTVFLNQKKSDAKGWLFEIMICIETLRKDTFSLDDMYQFEGQLREIFPENNHIKPKIRQQLQILRDNGYLEFCGKGQYQLTHPTASIAYTSRVLG